MRSTCFLTDEWIESANKLFASLTIDPVSATWLELELLRPPDGVVPRLVVEADLGSGGLRLSPAGADAGEDADVLVRLPYEAAAALLLGSGEERAQVFESEEVELEGDFTRVFFLDGVLQRDRGGVLAELRRGSSGIRAGLGARDWARAPATPVDAGTERAAVDAAERALPRTMRELRAEVGSSTPGAQLYVSHQSEPVASVGLGWCRPGVPFTHDAPTLWYCCAKPLSSLALGQLWERGLLDPWRPLAAYLPGFAGPGRDEITLYHVLTHTGPVPTGNDPLHGCLAAPMDARRRRVHAMRIPEGSAPERRVNYVQWWAWLLIADLIEALDGRGYTRYLEEEVLGPCGLSDTRVQLSGAEYRRLRDRLPLIWVSDGDGGMQPAAWFSTEHSATRCIPGINTRGTMADLGRFFEVLLAGGQAPGGRVAAPTTVAAITGRHRTTLRDAFGNADWGLGFRLESRHYGDTYVTFSRYSSLRTFGHDGLWTSVVFADPEVELVVALHLNGKVDHNRHRGRMLRIGAAVYEDLGLDRAGA